MRPKRFVGIDPGTTGAVVVLDECENLMGCNMMPIQKIEKRSEVNGFGLASLLCGSDFGADPDRTLITVEAQRPFGMGRTSAFTYGKNYGAILAIASALEIRTMRYMPRDWQRELLDFSPGCDTKELATAFALGKWPTLEQVLRLKKNQGIADAACIALYGLRMYRRE